MQPNTRKEAYMKKKTAINSAGERAAYLVGWLGAFASSTRRTISDWCGKGRTALSHADGSVWEPPSSSFLHRGPKSGEAAFPTRCSQIFLPEAESRLYQRMSEPRSCHEFSIGKDGFCFHPFCKPQTVAHRSLVTSSELARWLKPRGFWR